MPTSSMATSANHHNGALPVDDSKMPFDPFVSSSSDNPRQRYSAFDGQNFSLFATGSPSQAKRALEAHLEETERRLQEASHMGTVLVKQRQELSQRLKEVEEKPEGEEIGPELRQKLAELEREAQDISRETSRVFIQKSRVPSGENAGAEGGSGIFSSQAQHSPSKIVAPSSRKQRNQMPTRLNDVRLATEISTSLLNQVKELQSAYAEKDEALRTANSEKGELEVQLQSLLSRFKQLDESEQRFKDDNWSLETQLHELKAWQKEATDRENRLTQSLKTTKTEKDTLEREFEELRQTHGKLSEEHAATRKLHDTEVNALKRTAGSNESEMMSLQKKVEELTSQNKELAQAVAYRLRAKEREDQEFLVSDGPDEDDENITPGHSPPPSPTKATPRHGALETETLKSSLGHSYRTIQSLKNQLHREKTEKLEFKRLLQDARDELESRRHDGSGKKKRTNNEKDPVKKTMKAEHLGAVRRSRDEIIMDDSDWEELAETPSKPPTGGLRSATSSTEAIPRPGAKASSSSVDQATDAYVTATENSDAFETANEFEASNTETDAFQTGVETLDGNSSSGSDLTETEGSIVQRRQVKKRPSPLNRLSFQSTASTDEEEEMDVQTPVQPQHPKYKVRISRAGLRKSSGRDSLEAIGGAISSFRDSPASAASSSGTPVAAGKSLFAELGNLSDPETEEGTPQSGGLRSLQGSPELVKKSPAPSKLRYMHSSEIRAEMVDAGTMTEPWGQDQSSSKGFLSNVGSAIAGGLGGLALGRRSKSAGDDNIEDEDALKTPTGPPAGFREFPSPSSDSSEDVVQSIEVPSMPKELLVYSPILSQTVEPEDPPRLEKSPTMDFSQILYQHSEPSQSVHPSPQQVPLSFSSVAFQETRPETSHRGSAAVQTDSKSPTSSTGTSTKSGLGLFGTVFRRSKPTEKPEDIKIAEDQPKENEPDVKSEESEAANKTSEARLPFQPVDANSQTLTRATSDRGVAASSLVPTVTDSTQTNLSGQDIEKLLKGGSRPSPIDVAIAPPAGAILGSTSPRKLRDPVHRRPGSPGSIRSRGGSPPPLPAEAKQVIAAAQRSSLNSQTGAPTTDKRPAAGSMGPPLMPASAYNRNTQGLTLRPRTPAGTSSAAPSPILKQSTQVPGRSGLSSPVTRRSSVSSFASELDQRFNIPRNSTDARGYEQPGADPRMIQAITQTMIGEYLWKYTRKAGRDDISDNRHRRFFWMHPYTKQLYWSEQDPTAAGKELKAKSVAIESVRAVEDDNAAPPGLHRKSIVVVTPARTIKFTAPTSQIHETWFNALSYLLFRTSGDDEDTDGADPQYRSVSRNTARSRASMSSYASRYSSRMDSPSVNYPTLRASAMNPQRASSHHGSISGRISTMFRGSPVQRGSFSSRHSSRASAHGEDDEHAHGYGHHHGHGHGHGKWDGPGMENVRACCDGKHDVGSLSRAQSSRHIYDTVRTVRNSSYQMSMSSTHSRKRSATRNPGLMEMDPANIAN